MRGERGREGRGLALLAAALFVAAFLAYRPRIWAISDEAYNAGMAHAIARGTFDPERAGLTVVSTYPVPSPGEGRRGKLPVGYPVLLAPFTPFGTEVLFLLPLLAHLAGFCLFRSLLTSLGVPLRLSFLYLLHPAAALYSRTLMSNVPAATLLLAALLAWVRARPALAGGLVGAASLVRYPDAAFAAGLFFPPFVRGAAALLREEGWRALGAEVSRALRFGAGAAPFALLLLAGNAYATGSPFAFSYALAPEYGDAGGFSLSNLPRHVPVHLLSLAAIYPGLAASPLLRAAPLRGEAGALLLVYLLVHGSHFYLAKGGSPLETAVLNLRFFLPILPGLLVPYLAGAERLLARAPRAAARILPALVLFATSGVVFSVSRAHDRVVRRQAALADALHASTAAGSVLLGDAQVLKLLDPSRGRRTGIDLAEYERESLQRALDAGQEVYFVRVEEGARWVDWNERFLENLRQDFHVERTRASGKGVTVYRVRAPREGRRA